MRKKILATVLTAAMAVSILAGCSSDSANKASEAAATTAAETTAAEESKADETTAAEAKDAGDLRTVSFPNADAVVAAKAQGIPVKVVHTTYQEGLGAIIFGSDSGISTPADLKGKKVAVTSLGSANYFQLQAALESAGLTIDDVQVEIVGTGAILTALTEGQVDAIVFSKLRTIELNNSGFAASEITCDQFLPSFGNVLVAGDALVEKDPETVDGFCRALNKAIEYIIDGHVEEAVDMSIEKYAPTFAEKRDVVVQILNDVFVKTLWQSDYTAENGIGASDPEKWQALINKSKEIGNIDETFDAAELLYTPAK